MTKEEILNQFDAIDALGGDDPIIHPVVTLDAKQDLHELEAGDKATVRRSLGNI